ncbi:BTB/POZ-like domain containing protein [Rhodotorula toruloides]|uniref:BTB/POZ-like domain containing protein n=1 Tax=Rhodotorula toruloides TaxID=5286 RepID=A0A511KL32_RHOTO|nr:BTB/POZ-like domain containing protein [Rhodotorula toruloides]
MLSPARPPSLDASVAASSVVEDADEDDDEFVEEWVECRLRIQEENAASFQDLLCHVYPRLDCAITWSNVEDLSRMALLFDIPSLSNACLAFLLPSAAGRPVLCMKIAEEMGIPALYREASRYILDNYAGWTSEELAVLDPSTLLKLERKRSWFLERLLKLGQVSILRDYSCQPACDDPSRCARLVDEKWRSAFAAAFRFGTPQPSIIYRSLRLLEPSLSSPALHLPYTACQAHAKLWVVDLFDRMFQLGITPARNWTSLTLGGLPASASATTSSGTWAHLRTGAGDTVATQKNTSARYFLSIEMREESASVGERRKERGFASFGG